MSKTTFEPKAKAFIAGNNFEAEGKIGTGKAIKLEGDQYEIGDAVTALGDALKPIVEAGPFGAPPPSYMPNQFNLRIQKVAKDEYVKQTGPVEFPPAFIETIALLPDDKEDQAKTLQEAGLYWTDYLNYYKAEKAHFEKTLGTPNLSFDAADTIKQRLSKLNEAIKFTEKQIELSKKFVEGK